MTLRGMTRLDAGTASLLHAVPTIDGETAPIGTLFVLGEDGGWAAPPRRGRKLVLGRPSGDHDVHVVISQRDDRVSREHAVVECGVTDNACWWSLRNSGRRPIRIPDTADVLRSHEVVLPSGYTPLFVRGAALHVVEVLVWDGLPPGAVGAGAGATSDGSERLRPRERLVLLALFENVLQRTTGAGPLTWQQTADRLNEVPGQAGWTERAAEAVVAGVRERLAGVGVPGVFGRDTPADRIKPNLQQHLLDTATLVPPDLRLLETGLGGLL